MIGKRIKKVRNDMELSQTEFGARMGYSRDIIGNTEAERVEMKPYLIKSICSVYNVNEQWLLTGEGDMYTLPKEEIACFNPCFNGTYSLTIVLQVNSSSSMDVLILVLMELTL